MIAAVWTDLACRHLGRHDVVRCAGRPGHTWSWAHDRWVARLEPVAPATDPVTVDPDPVVVDPDPVTTRAGRRLLAGLRLRALAPPAGKNDLATVGRHRG